MAIQYLNYEVLFIESSPFKLEAFRFEFPKIDYYTTTVIIDGSVTPSPLVLLFLSTCVTVRQLANLYNLKDCREASELWSFLQIISSDNTSPYFYKKILSDEWFKLVEYKGHKAKKRFIASLYYDDETLFSGYRFKMIPKGFGLLSPLFNPDKFFKTIPLVVKTTIKYCVEQFSNYPEYIEALIKICRECAEEFSEGMVTPTTQYLRVIGIMRSGIDVVEKKKGINPK